MARRKPTPEDRERGARMRALREHWGFQQIDIVPENHTQVSGVESGVSQLRSAKLLSQYGKAFGVPSETISAYADGEIEIDDLEARSKVPKRDGNKSVAQRGSMHAVKRERDSLQRAKTIAQDIAEDGQYRYPDALVAVVEVRDTGSDLVWRKAALRYLVESERPPPTSPSHPRPPDFHGRGSSLRGVRRNS